MGVVEDDEDDEDDEGGDDDDDDDDEDDDDPSAFAFVSGKFNKWSGRLCWMTAQS